jgi:hypothetical protein
MARIVHNQNNFTAGEITPRMKGRGDVARYQNGAEIIENGVVVVHGGIMRRSGTRYLATAKYGGARKVRLIRYVFNVEQSYVLEFGHGYIRVFDGATGAVLLNDVLAVLEIPSPYSDAQLAQITTKQSADVMFIFHPDVQPRQLRRLTPTQWVLLPVPWTVQPFSENGHQPNAVLSLSAATVGAGRTFTTTPTSVPDAPTIGTAYPLKASASVNFTPPANTGGLPIDYYEVTSSPGGIVATGPSSPVRVTGLTNGVAYTFTVKAHNGVGLSAASAASNSVTPLATLPDGTITVTADTLNFAAVVENGPQGVAGPTATGSAGTAPYTYAWSKRSGSGALSITRANTAQVVLASENYGAPNYATLRCTVTDALGSVGTVDVNVSIRHRTFREPGLPPGGVIP